MITVGFSNFFTLQDMGLVYAWGWGVDGQTGNGETHDQYEPVQVLLLPPVVAISCGGYHSMALTQSGEVFSWGYGNAGRLGNGDDKNVLVPEKIKTLSSVVQIATGLSHSMALTENGDIYCWGRNADRQLGLDSEENGILIPTLAPALKRAVGDGQIFWQSHVNHGNPNELSVKVLWKYTRYLWLGNKDSQSLLSVLPLDVIQIIQRRFCETWSTPDNS